MERRHRSDLAFAGFGQDSRQTCSRIVPVVLTSTFSHNAIETQRACPQQSGEALKLLQG